MIPCLYASMEKKFDNNGIGKMADAHSCVVTEKRNGSFELEMVYPADGIHADQLEEGNIILAKPSDTGRSQPFRIYKISTPIDGKLTVKARHISYQLMHTDLAQTKADMSKEFSETHVAISESCDEKQEVQTLEYKTKTEMACALLKQYLVKGDMASKEIYERLGEAGISRRTIAETKHVLGIQSYRKMRQWYWTLRE